LGYAGDLGLIITAPVFGFPRLAIAVLDVGGTKMREQRTLFTSDGGKEGAPPDIPQRINVGVGTFYKMSRGGNASLNFELKDVEKAIHGNPIDSIHIGAEAVMAKKFSLRIGLNDGRYWTAGAGLHILRVGLEFATYGENISHKDGGRTADRKYALRTYVEF
jgi:hypothetical protein